MTAAAAPAPTATANFRVPDLVTVCDPGADDGGRVDHDRRGDRGATDHRRHGGATRPAIEARGSHAGAEAAPAASSSSARKALASCGRSAGSLAMLRRSRSCSSLPCRSSSGARLVDDPAEGPRQVRPGERGAAGQEGEQHGGGRVDVARLAQRLPACRLRTHVRRRTREPGRAHGSREPEVHELRRALHVGEDVAGEHVAVQDAFLVRVGQARARRRGPRPPTARGSGPVHGKDAPKRRAVDPLLREPGPVVLLDVVVDLHEVGVREAGQDLGLRPQTGPAWPALARCRRCSSLIAVGLSSSTCRAR